MALTRHRLGDFIELVDVRNIKGLLSEKDVRGISTDKEFITTKADLADVNLSNYKVVAPEEFAYVADTSRRGDKISLAFNFTTKNYLVSSISIVFRCRDRLLPKYLFMYFRRPEFDRFSRFNSWGSAREAFSWEDMCDIEIELPSIEVQRKYVAIYEAMCENQRCYEAGLEDLKLACDAEIEKLQKAGLSSSIGDYIEQVDNRNNDVWGQDKVRGISTDKELIETKARLDGVSLGSYKVFNPQEIAYVADTSRRGDKISIAQNTEDTPYLLSSISVVFKCKEQLDPRYLMLFFSRAEFDRYARFNSWGSARETFDWAEMENVRIPIPPIEVQRSIADLFTAYNQRKEINERLKAQIKDLCPILIKGSLEEASKA